MSARGPSRGSSHRAGMTLIEVVLAISILSLGLVYLLTAATRCLAVIKASQYYQTAQWTLGLGEQEFPLLSIMELDDMRVPPTQYPNGMTYEREIDEDEDEDMLYVVTTRVSWESRGRNQQLEVVRYLLYDEEDE